MTTSDFIFWGAWFAICLVATTIHIRAIIQATRSLRRSKRERDKVVSAKIERFELCDGWIRALVRLREVTEAPPGWTSEKDRFETWVIEPGHGTWQRLPDMIDAPFSWGAWLTHELVAFNARRVTDAFSENEKNR